MDRLARLDPEAVIQKPRDIAARHIWSVPREIGGQR